MDVPRLHGRGPRVSRPLVFSYARALKNLVLDAKWVVLLGTPFRRSRSPCYRSRRFTNSPVSTRPAPSGQLSARRLGLTLALGLP
jgi:hypothetical protein